MIDLKCLQILSFLIASAFSNTTTPLTPITVRNEYTNLTTTIEVAKINIDAMSEISKVSTDNVPLVLNQSISTNVTKNFNSDGKRRTVVIINHPTALRNRGRKRKSKKGGGFGNAKVETLLYEEYDADGTKLAEFMMYTMEDVTKFFASFLHTELCHVRCEPRPEDIAREEAKKAASSTRRP